MGWWQRLWGGSPAVAEQALYAAAVARARAPDWYVEGRVPDTLDGRFDMIATVLALAMLRLEAEPAGRAAAARLMECFIADMDGQLRQIGIGDVVVGKEIGKVIGLLGGRIGAYREGLAAGDLKPALVRNLYRGTDPGAASLDHVATQLTELARALAATPLTAVLAGDLP